MPRQRPPAPRAPGPPTGSAGDERSLGSYATGHTQHAGTQHIHREADVVGRTNPPKEHVTSRSRVCFGQVTVAFVPLLARGAKRGGADLHALFREAAVGVARGGWQQGPGGPCPSCAGSLPQSTSRPWPGGSTAGGGPRRTRGTPSAGPPGAGAAPRPAPRRAPRRRWTLRQVCGGHFERPKTLEDLARLLGCWCVVLGNKTDKRTTQRMAD